MAHVDFTKGSLSFHRVVKVVCHDPVDLSSGFYTSLIVVEDDGTESEINFHHKDHDLLFEAEEIEDGN